MPENIVVRPSIRAAFEQVMEQGRVLFFSAPCGFGKSVVAEELLKGKKRVCRLAASEPGFALPAADGSWDILLIDDLQHLQSEEDHRALCALIRSDPERRYVLLFDRDDIRALFDKAGVAVTDSELSGILKESIGHPLGVAVTVRLVTQAFREVFLYFETAIYRRFDLPVRQFLLELASFDSFDLEMARMVSGSPRAAEMLDWLQRNTSMLRYDGISTFHFWPQFKAFLIWEMEREYTEEKQRAIFSRGGLYYELKEDYPHALDCYSKSGDHSKVSELLTHNAELHPGMGHHSEMEPYYRSLQESEIKVSPSLMQSMSMLCSLSMDYEGAEKWYEALRAFAARCGRGDAAGRQARSRLAWLDISLP